MALASDSVSEQLLEAGKEQILFCYKKRKETMLTFNVFGTGITLLDALVVWWLVLMCGIDDCAFNELQLSCIWTFNFLEMW